MSKLIFRVVLLAFTVIFLAEMPEARRSRTRGFSTSTSRRRQTSSNNEGGDVNTDVSTDSGDDGLGWLTGVFILVLLFLFLLFLCLNYCTGERCDDCGEKTEDGGRQEDVNTQDQEFDEEELNIIRYLAMLQVLDDTRPLPEPLQFDNVAKDDDDDDDDGQDSHDVSTTAAKDDDDDGGVSDSDSGGGVNGDDDGQDRHDVSTAIGTASASISDDSSHDPTMRDNIACKGEEENLATLSQAKFSPASRGGSSTSEPNDTIPRKREKEDNVDSTKGKEPTDVGQEHVTHKPTSPYNQQQTDVFTCKSQPESVKPNTSRFCDDARVTVDQ